jgi:peptidoglycan/LPS O-acetylase OafA/YrhL
VFGTPVFMIAFLGVLIAWSIVSFRYFERPVQAWVRRRLSKS